MKKSVLTSDLKHKRYKIIDFIKEIRFQSAKILVFV